MSTSGVRIGMTIISTISPFKSPTIQKGLYKAFTVFYAGGAGRVLRKIYAVLTAIGTILES
jgi:hypothetical protein